MKRHFFINKMNTIFQSSNSNFGNSPIVELNHGWLISRILLSFNIDKIKEMIEDKSFGDIENLTHRLVMTNCGSIDIERNNKNLEGVSTFPKKRTHSFDVIAFKLPCDFDEGVGSILQNDGLTNSSYAYSTDGSNWFQSKNGASWKRKRENNYEGADDGIYEQKYLQEQYKKYINEEPSIIIGHQHFDKGYENLNIDLTSYLNDVLKNPEENFFGIGLAFLDEKANSQDEYSHYVGFFSNNSNTIYHPYIETVSKDEETINDSRMNFKPGKDNNLYLYCEENEQPINLDEIPTCSIDGEPIIDVKHVQKGVYCAHIPAETVKGDNYTMKYDTWSNLALNGLSLDDVELSFVIAPNNNRLSLGDNAKSTVEAVPVITTLNDNDTILYGERYKIEIEFTEKYNFGAKKPISKGEYRIRFKEGSDFITLFDFTPIDLKNNLYSFDLFAEDFLPGKYFIDIKIKNGYNTKIYNDVCHFNVKNDVTDRYK